jgi:hypothetical protein
MQRSVETILVEKYHISKQDLGRALSAFYRCPFVENLDRLPMTPDLVQRLNPTYLKANLWIPLQESKDNVTVLIDDPQDFSRFQDIRRLFQEKKSASRLPYAKTLPNMCKRSLTLANNMSRSNLFPQSYAS